MSKLNCEEARKLSIVDYLAKCGINPVHVRGNNHWYLSPLRDEKHASFKVDSHKNLWFDHGMGAGGNFIDLAIRLHHCSVEELLAHLTAGNYNLSFHSPSAGPGMAELVTPELVRTALNQQYNDINAFLLATKQQVPRQEIKSQTHERPGHDLHR